MRACRRRARSKTEDGQNVKSRLAPATNPPPVHTQKATCVGVIGSWWPSHARAACGAATTVSIKVWRSMPVFDGGVTGAAATGAGATGAVTGAGAMAIGVGGM